MRTAGNEAVSTARSALWLLWQNDHQPSLYYIQTVMTGAPSSLFVCKDLYCVNCLYCVNIHAASSHGRSAGTLLHFMWRHMVIRWNLARAVEKTARSRSWWISGSTLSESHHINQNKLGAQPSTPHPPFSSLCRWWIALPVYHLILLNLNVAAQFSQNLYWSYSGFPSWTWIF